MANVGYLKKIRMIPRQTEIWKCEKCKNVFYDTHSQYLVCPTCGKVCFNSCSIGEVRLYRDSIGERHIPHGIEPSENDFLNAIESDKHSTIFSILPESELYYTRQHSIASLRLHAFRAARNNELHGIHPELKNRRIDNARMLALAIEPGQLLFEIFEYLGEYEKCVSAYDLIPISKWRSCDLKRYISAKSIINPEFDKERERESLCMIKDAAKAEWEKKLASLQTSAGIEVVVEKGSIVLLVLSLAVAAYLLLRVNWIYAVVFGFISLKLIGRLDSFVFSQKYNRVEKWKKEHPKPIDF